MSFHSDWLNGLLGGALIGVAVSLMLALNGRVTGVSGIVNGILTPQRGDLLWRVVFIAGMVTGGLSLLAFRPDIFISSVETKTATLVIAGLLVGFGTVMGSGCTSGHGVCGISRMSVRSLLATMTFIAAGILTVALARAGGFF
jgi:uncharacterized membrane protein YedE/YeeE